MPSTNFMLGVAIAAHSWRRVFRWNVGLFCGSRKSLQEVCDSVFVVSFHRICGELRFSLPPPETSDLQGCVSTAFEKLDFSTRNPLQLRVLLQAYVAGGIALQALQERQCNFGANRRNLYQAL